MRTVRTMLLFGAGAAVLAGGALTTAAQAVNKPAKPRSVKINGFTPPPFSFTKGGIVKGQTVRFQVKNVDFETHNFKIYAGNLSSPKGKAVAGTSDLPPNKTSKIFPVKFAKKGVYTIFCTIPGHSLSMRTTLTVK